MTIQPQHDPSCWGCGDHPSGLHLPLPAAEGLTEYEAFTVFDARHQGGPGIVHGGFVAAALDEACGLLAAWLRFPVVTMRLDVRYRRPVKIDTEVLLRAQVDDATGSRIRTSATITDGDEVLAQARVALLHVPLEHFLQTVEGQAIAQRYRA